MVFFPHLCSVIVWICFWFVWMECIEFEMRDCALPLAHGESSKSDGEERFGWCFVAFCAEMDYDLLSCWLERMEIWTCDIPITIEFWDEGIARLWCVQSHLSMEAENGFSLIFVSSILREIAPDFVLIGNEGIGLVTRPSRPHFQMREIRMRIAFGVI